MNYLNPEEERLKKWLDDELKRNARLTNEMADLRAQVAGLRAVVEAAREAARIAETWDCSEVWDDDGDCIEHGAMECLRCSTIHILDTALATLDRGE